MTPPFLLGHSSESVFNTPYRDQFCSSLMSCLPLPPTKETNFYLRNYFTTNEFFSPVAPLQSYTPLGDPFSPCAVTVWTPQTCEVATLPLWYPCSWVYQETLPLQIMPLLWLCVFTTSSILQITSSLGSAAILPTPCHIFLTLTL